MPRDFKNPPSWAPNAIATEKGWVDPKTKELLVSIKGLKIKKKAPAPTNKKTTKKTVSKKKSSSKKKN